MFTVARDIKISGSQAFNLVGNDDIVIRVKGIQEFKYKVPDGRNGAITITLSGLLTDPEVA